MTSEDKKPQVEAQVESIDEELLQTKDKDELIAMFMRLMEAKDYIQLMLMQLTVGNERNIKVMHELNTQLKMKDLWIETVIGELGRDKISLPEGMVLYSGEDYVHFWEGEDQQQKGDLKENVKEDLAAKANKDEEA